MRNSPHQSLEWSHQLATYAFIRGYLHTGEDLFDDVRKVINEFEQSDETPEHKRYLDECWCFPTNGRYCGDCVFLSANIKVASLPYFESLLIKIGESVFDDDFGTLYPITGRFEVTIEGQNDNQIWTLMDSRLDTSKRVSLFQSP